MGDDGSRRRLKVSWENEMNCSYFSEALLIASFRFVSQLSFKIHVSQTWIILKFEDRNQKDR
jgi:hypothetical protein